MKYFPLEVLKEIKFASILESGYKKLNSEEKERKEKNMMRIFLQKNLQNGFMNLRFGMNESHSLNIQFV